MEAGLKHHLQVVQRFSLDKVDKFTVMQINGRRRTACPGTGLDAVDDDVFCIRNYGDGHVRADIGSGLNNQSQVVPIGVSASQLALSLRPSK